MRAVAGYGAALAMTPYLLIKVSWVAVGLGSPAATGAVVLNTVTIGMAAAGIALALALVRPWGERIPALPVLACAWIGGGFLIPMLPYAIVDSLISPPGADPAMPAWEYPLLQASFLGMGAGLAVALPLYLRARWPAAFEGRAGDHPAPVRPIPALSGAAALILFDVYQAAGGVTGTSERLQAGNAALWTLGGAWGLWALTRTRPGPPRWAPLTVTWLASGFLVAWSAWKLPFALLGVIESGPLETAHLALGIVVGAVMLRAVTKRPPA